MWELIPRVIGIFVGLFVGGFNERRHLKSLTLRESTVGGVVLTNLKRPSTVHEVEYSTMVIGQVVIATDYFKTFVTTLRNLVGGEMKAALPLLSRARREALLRMTDEARRLGATEVCNVRLQFSSVNMMRGSNGAMQVEMLAYGTAIIPRRAEQVGTTAPVAA